MDLTLYLDGLRRDLVAAASPGGADVARAADLLGGALEPSARLCLLEALSDAAAEITTKLAHGSVEVRLRGRETQFVVTESEPPAPVAPPTPAGPAGSQPAQDAESGDIARITLRLPEGLKDAVERAAAADGISANAWLVRAIAHTVTWPPGPGFFPPGPGFFPPGRGRLGRRVTGYARS
jgi:hypothetical protein